MIHKRLEAQKGGGGRPGAGGYRVVSKVYLSRKPRFRPPGVRVDHPCPLVVLNFGAFILGGPRSAEKRQADEPGSGGLRALVRRTRRSWIVELGGWGVPTWSTGQFYAGLSTFHEKSILLNAC